MAEPQAAAAARRACADVAAELPGELGTRFELLVTELVTNAVRHGSARVTDVVSLDVRVSDAVLHAQVRDGGPGFEPPVPPQRGRLSQGGWGLVLVDALADRWGAAGAIGRVWFELDLRAAGNGRRRCVSALTVARNSGRVGRVARRVIENPTAGVK